MKPIVYLLLFVTMQCLGQTTSKIKMTQFAEWAATKQ